MAVDKTFTARVHQGKLVVVRNRVVRRSIVHFQRYKHKQLVIQFNLNKGIETAIEKQLK
ncbi:MAG: hypothetical protein ACFFD4_24040 [Candidatus Odinarchaeota archaeon]